MNKTPQLRRHALNAMNALNVIGGGQDLQGDKLQQSTPYEHPTFVPSGILSSKAFRTQSLDRSLIVSY